jgi:hypothetical protein
VDRPEIQLFCFGWKFETLKLIRLEAIALVISVLFEAMFEYIDGRGIYSLLWYAVHA